MYRLTASQAWLVPAKITLGLAAVLATLWSGAALAAGSATSAFQTQITIQASCTILSTATLDFQTQGVLVANVDRQADIAVQCTNSTTYNVGLDAGTGSGATVTTRKMTSGAGATISYSLYTDA